MKPGPDDVKMRTFHHRILLLHNHGDGGSHDQQPDLQPEKLVDHTMPLLLEAYDLYSGPVHVHPRIHVLVGP